MTKMSVRALGVFSSGVILFYGLSWTIIEIAEYFKADLVWLQKLGGLAHYLIVLHSILLSIVITGIDFWVNRKNYVDDSTEDIEKLPGSQKTENPKDTANGKIVLDDLHRSLQDSLKAKRFDEVIRIGRSLSRPLLISGNFKDKVSIGKLIEEAAASTGRKSEQMASLIDDLGWPSVELGDLDSGEKYLRHGLSLAKERNDSYYKSIASRHLGAIYRRRKDYVKAGEFFGDALNFANEISDETTRSATIAGAQYAFASLSHHTGAYDDAIARLRVAINQFRAIDDTTGETRALSKLAGSLLANGEIEEARDIYRQALNVARSEGYRHQVVKCLIGLAKICIKEGAADKALEFLDDARSIAVEIQAQSEISEIESMQSTLRNKVEKS